MSIPRFRITSSIPADQRIAITDAAEVHHATRVLRLRVGDACIAFDGAGAEYHGHIDEIGAQAMTLRIDRIHQASAGAGVRITLAQALPKWPAFDEVLRHATELGVARIAPLLTERTVVRVRPGEWEARRARSERIIASAAKQCGRSTLPALDDPVRWRAWPELHVTATQHVTMQPLTRVMPTLAVDAPLLADVMRARGLADQVTLCIGPEGDFTVEEAMAWQRVGGCLVSLGSLTLRAETAALACLAVLQHEWSRQQPCNHPAG